LQDANLDQLKAAVICQQVQAVDMGLEGAWAGQGVVELVQVELLLIIHGGLRHIARNLIPNSSHL